MMAINRTFGMMLTRAIAREEADRVIALIESAQADDTDIGGSLLAWAKEAEPMVKHRDMQEGLVSDFNKVRDAINKRLQDRNLID